MFNRDTGFASLKMIFLRGQLPPKRQEPLSTLTSESLSPASPKENALHGRLSSTEMGAHLWVLVGREESRQETRESADQ